MNLKQVTLHDNDEVVYNWSSDEGITDIRVECTCSDYKPYKSVKSESFIGITTIMNDNDCVNCYSSLMSNLILSEDTPKYYITSGYDHNVKDLLELDKGE